MEKYAFYDLIGRRFFLFNSFNKKKPTLFARRRCTMYACYCLKYTYHNAYEYNLTTVSIADFYRRFKNKCFYCSSQKSENRMRCHDFYNKRTI